jgi:integrase
VAVRLRRAHKLHALNRISRRRPASSACATPPVKTATINLSLAVVRRIVNLAASEWRDVQGMTWLEHAAKIKLLPVKDARPAYPLSREEQAAHFQELPDHLARMSLFKVNTGTREQEVCGLKWTDEVQVPELNTSVFIIEGDKVKNEQDRLIVLNRVARSVVDSVRGQHPEYVFVRYPRTENAKPVPLDSMNTTAWKNGRKRAADKWGERTGEPAPDGFRRLTRSQEWADHDALLGGRACKPHCCGGEGLRRQLPQIPRNHVIAAEGEIARWTLTSCFFGQELVPAAGIEPATP